jgi:hypothetical protein
MRQSATHNTVSINVVGSSAEMLCSAVSRGISCRKERYPDREMWICGVREIDKSLRCCIVLIGCAEYFGFVCRWWSNDRIWIKTLRKKNKKAQWNQKGSGTGVNVLSDKYYKITGIDGGADKSLARPTSRYILFDGENNSFDAGLVLYIYIYRVFHDFRA